MSFSRVIDRRGRVTVPREIRRRLGLSAGDRVDFVCERGLVVLRSSRPPKDVFAKYRGALGTFPGGKKGIKAWLRDLRDY